MSIAEREDWVALKDRPRIHVLPDLLVNKIAAGEVVERPASVVKELVDNAIDAGAKRITVAIEDGGKQLIRVTDDGCGMTADDLRLAITPHATSKIQVEDDLYSISSLGFRGEALPSISAVSKLRLVSRAAGCDEGHEVRVVAETVESALAAGCPTGTTVEVRDLFFNVPARRRFLRANSTEVGHINEQIARFALAHPGIGFELSNNGRVTQRLPESATRIERIGKLYGVELASALLNIERDERGLTIEAYAAPPAHTRANAQWQYIFVNGRYIRDRYVQHAIKEAYRGLVEAHRHAVIFLFLSTDPRLVDVNVHPTKIEVRWADSNLVHSQVLAALRETFQRCDLTPALKTDRAAGAAMRPTDPAEADRVRREFAAALKQVRPIEPGRHAHGSPEGGRGGLPFDARAGSSGGQGSHFPSRPYGADVARGREGFGGTGGRGPFGGGLRAWESLYGAPNREDANSDGGSDVAAAADRDAMPTSPKPDETASPRPRAIQMHNLYLVAETPEGIVIIDQHALHERIMYDQLSRRITAGPLEAQRLLLPVTLNVTPSQAALLETNADLLRRLGIETTRFGSDSVAVQSFPMLLGDTDVAGFMRDLIDHLAQQPAGSSTEVVIHSLLDMMACKAAIKAGDPLTDEEIEALIRRKDLVEKSSNCPHGRPTMLRFTLSDLERQFKRT